MTQVREFTKDIGLVNRIGFLDTFLGVCYRSPVRPKALFLAEFTPGKCSRGRHDPDSVQSRRWRTS
jgi:hypothetical protein